MSNASKARFHERAGETVLAGPRDARAARRASSSGERTLLVDQTSATVVPDAARTRPTSGQRDPTRDAESTGATVVPDAARTRPTSGQRDPTRDAESTGATVVPAARPASTLEVSRTDPTRGGDGSSRARWSAQSPACDTLEGEPRSAVHTLLEPGVRFDGYRLTRRIGGGAMGEVLEADDLLLERPVAIKLLHEGSIDAEARERFKVEARAVARMQHPNVVSIYRVGEVAGRPYLVSELVRGRPLDELPTPVANALALRIAYDIALGLAAAHQRGVVHRDLKPANAILSDDGVVKLLDFGIAKLVPAGASATTDRDRRTVSSHQRGDANDDARNGCGGASCVALPLGSRAQDLTRNGAALGTPRYMAPEVWLGEAATFQSDVYSFGALLFRLCAGRPVHVAADLETLRERVTGTNAPPLGSVAPGVDPRLAEIVDACLRRNPAERPEHAGALRARLAELLPGARDRIATQRNPYRGLRAFEPRDKDLFFGRDSEVRMIIDRLRSEPFVLAAGDSGVGKSSLCRAGVLSRLETQDGPRRWLTVTVMPGPRPVTAVASALAPILGTSEAALARQIEEDPAGVARAIRAWQGSGLGVVVFVDQLEELTTLSHPAEAAAVAELLGWLAVPSDGIRLLASVRSDFLSRVAGLPGIGPRVPAALYFVRPLTAERLREIIVEPAQSQGVAIEPGELVDELVAGALDADGGLPLLQFALAELWDAIPQGATRITRETLDAVGGVTGALGRHADAVLEAMAPAERDAARSVLLGLITAERTRARRTEAEIAVAWLGAQARATEEQREAALAALVRGRLVVACQGPDGASYEIAHEALVTGWSTLDGWLSETDAARRTRERLGRAAAEWDRHGRPRELLWRKVQLERLGSTAADSLVELERCFVHSSRRSLARARATRAGALLALPIALGAGFGLLTLERSWQLDAAITHRVLAAESLRSAEMAASNVAAEQRDEALAQFDAQRATEGEAHWLAHERALAIASEHQSHAAQTLETALLLDAERPETRSALGDLLLGRAMLAETRHDEAAVDESLRRLALYDDDGSRHAAWRASAKVTFDVEPAHATVRVARYVLDHRGRYASVAVGEWRGDGDGHRFEPGSFLAEIEAEGYELVRLPFVVERGADQALSVRLPSEGTVPAGYAYVPPGHGSFGSAARNQERRDFFHHVPLHSVEVDGFIIGRHEATFGDFVAYLESLDPDERRARVPRVGAGGFQGGLELTREDDGRWTLRFKPAGVVLSATGPEPIRYPGRSTRAAQDWRRLPVTGVTADDAEQYAAWLDRSGRVPGARLCTEKEWERAARGVDGREYPHGDELGPDDANHDETYGKVPTAMGPDEVGSHPASASPFGIEDMAGNAWEWARSSLDPSGHTARGGSFAFGANSSRTTDRELTEPTFRDASVGFRVCASWSPAEVVATRP